MKKRGFSVIEFVIASSLTVALVATVTLSTSAIQRNMAKNKAKTQITLFAQNLLETARAFNCGSEVLPNQGDSSLGESKKIYMACKNELVTKSSNQQVDVNYECSDNGGYKASYKEWSPCLPGSIVENDINISSSNITDILKIDKVIFSSQWITDIEDTFSGSSQIISTCNSIYNKLKTQPSLLRNTVKIIYSDPFMENTGALINNNKKIFEYSDIIAYPNNVDIYEDNLSVLFVITKQNQKISSISHNSHIDNIITREGIPCIDNSIDRYSIIFPYLPEGEYTIKDANGTGEVITILANKRCRFEQGGGGLSCL